MKKLALTLFMLGGAGAQSGPQLFEYSAPTTAILLRWTENNGQLSGAIQVVTGKVVDDGPVTEVFNGTVQGTRNASIYSFVANKPIALFKTASLDAVLDADTLTVQVPLESGGIGEFKLKRTTVEKFNSTVANLKSRIQQQYEMEAEVRAINGAALDIASQYTNIQQLSSQLKTAPDELRQSMRDAQKGLSDLQNRQKALIKLSAEKKCEQIEDLKDQDRLERPKLDEFNNAFIDNFNNFDVLMSKLETALKNYKVSKNSFLGHKYPSSKLPNDVSELGIANALLVSIQGVLKAAAPLARTLPQEVEAATETIEAISCTE